MSQATHKKPAPFFSDALIKALVIAAAVHIILLFGIHFTAPKARQFQRTIDVTVVKAPSKAAPENAQFQAAEDQQSQGESHSAPAPEQQMPSPVTEPQEPVKSVEPKKTKPKPKPIKKPLPKPEKPTPEPKPAPKKPPEKVEPKPAPKLLSQQTAQKKVAVQAKPTTRKHTEIRPHVSAETIMQQISQMGSEIQLKQESAEQNAIKYVNQVSTNKFLAAQYVKDWESKVERIGNLNYPEVATKKNFQATLTMQVGINADGSIYSIQISKSSGIPELDEAARHIVRMSAPFAPLPPALLKELKVLIVTRVWKFSDESTTVTQ